MTTNGIVLGMKLPKLKECGLNLLNISLDTLVLAKFELMTRRKGHDRVLLSINTAAEFGFDPVKVCSLSWEMYPLLLLKPLCFVFFFFPTYYVTGKIIMCAIFL